LQAVNGYPLYSPQPPKSTEAFGAAVPFKVVKKMIEK